MSLKIDTLQFELTTRCNLRCPYCYRALFGPIKNVDFDINLLKNISIENAKGYIVCGTVGDGIFYPKLKEFIKKCNERNPRIECTICTNGTAHGKDWWIDLAKILKNRNHAVIFGIDGFEDTHKLYRKNASYKKVMSNMKAFINAGGKAIWQFILFRHNEHELSKATRMSRELGCKDFLIRKSFSFDRSDKPKTVPIITRNDYGEISNERIKCRIDKGEISILANGDVMPCCHMIEIHERMYGFKALNLNDKHLDDIIKDGYIQRITDTKYERKFCYKCKADGEDYSIEELLLESIKQRKYKRSKNVQHRII